jgi:delta-aminolevulinic acid dehydratase/porphobilinogen synthase
LVDEKGYILGDKTIDAMVKRALCQPDAGVDIASPSDRVAGWIRT